VQKSSSLPAFLNRAYYLALPAGAEVYSLAAFQIEPTTWHFLKVQKSSSLPAFLNRAYYLALPAGAEG
jgi:hypothetical protein